MGLNRIQPAVAAKLAKSQKTAQKAAKVEPILPETMTLFEQLEEYKELSDPEIGEGQEISCQNVCKGISQAPKILDLELRGYFIAEDGTKTELAVTEPTIEESRSNTGSFSITSTASSKYSTCQTRVLRPFVPSPPPRATRLFFPHYVGVGTCISFPKTGQPTPKR